MSTAPNDVAGQYRPAIVNKVKLVILGVAEAGFFPCVILYLSYWFPERERARVVAQFMVALPVATLIAGPLSGLILDHVHWLGVSGWRWVFIIEGPPAVLLGLVTLFLLTDTPQQATDHDRTPTPAPAADTSR
ncbi:MFS transporter [Streptomyces sp. NEAU-174]|uniref:MFS transporter n=1 Tax=Streptomyces sp. NEAU-174 TaxID=3458254 RepID=UPI00404452D0